MPLVAGLPVYRAACVLNVPFDLTALQDTVSLVGQRLAGDCALAVSSALVVPPT